MLRRGIGKTTKDMVERDNSTAPGVAAPGEGDRTTAGGPHRRALMQAGGFGLAAAALSVLAHPAAAQQAQPQPAPPAQPQPPAPPPPPPGQPFSRQWLVDEARKLAGQAFVPPKLDVPERFGNLTFEQYRDIRYRNDRIFWRNDNRGFGLGLMSTGSVFKNPVDIFIVEDGLAKRIAFQRDMFEYGPNIKPPEDKELLGFSGLRLRRQINTPDRWDEVVSFQGATYFKALAKGLQYGVSARGLAINLSEDGNEEFPTFEQFYVERPEPGGNSIVVYALLDSPSCTGAYRFTTRADDTTAIDVEMVLFPRVEIGNVGLGTLSSMFLYDATSRTRFDDMRPAVHGSDGLAIRSGGGEAIFRPLANPRNLQISAFGDQNPRGFGLVQRRRVFEEFEDLETRFDLRPSAWVEPIGDWGEGAVNLVEIPSESEIHDNIVVFWRPKAKLQPKTEFPLAYRLHWAANPPIDTGFGQVVGTRIGASRREGYRRFVIDFRGPMPPADQLKLDVWASAGKIAGAGFRANNVRGGYRVLFELETRNIALAELRVLLSQNGRPVTETWLYRWTA